MPRLHMRLDSHQLKAIRDEISHLDSSVDVYLYSSRVDDTAKGGGYRFVGGVGLTGISPGAPVASRHPGSHRMATTRFGGPAA